MSLSETEQYPARLKIEYPDRDLDRLSSALRIFYAAPVAILLAFVENVLFPATLLMILFRRKYPRWWFDFTLQWSRFSTRVCAYLALMSDEYPSTDEEQYVRLDLDYPDARELNRGLPLVKWLLAVPHFVVLVFLWIAAIFVVLYAWFAILFTGRYPRGAFGFVEGTVRWSLRVEAYAFFLITDRYPPFALR